CSSWLLYDLLHLSLFILLSPPIPPSSGSTDFPLSYHVCLKSDRNWEKHGDKCYYFNDLYLRWKGSRSFCEDLGADLVKIDSREENVSESFSSDLIQEFLVEGIWTWVDGSPLDSRMKFWSEGEPDDYKAYSASGEDCVTIVKGEAEDLNSWTDYTCSVARKSICEKPAGTGLSSSVCG
uniref:C-type lectin domain-containing protein n=1 Tax=Nothobranchius furzeri TaxID=105023 RepID=A0A8C6PFX7_NOTFU